MSATVVDVGAGTGRLTRLLARRFASVIPVEPDEKRRALIDVGDVRAGTAEALPLPDASSDAVFVGDAFHWFDGPRALAEFARVLRPGGVLALFRSRFGPEDHLLPDGVLPPEPERVATDWRAAFAGAPFEPLRQIARPEQRRLSRDLLLDFFASTSPLTSLPAADRERSLARIAQALDQDEYTQTWTAVVDWTRRA